jgi:hypothetical protein
MKLITRKILKSLVLSLINPKSISIIESAFCWEGTVYTHIENIEESDDKIIMTFTVAGSSIVEHEGDVNGIYDQVNEWENVKIKLPTINHYATFSECSVAIEGQAHDDGEYTVRVTGSFKVTIQG